MTTVKSIIHIHTITIHNSRLKLCGKLIATSVPVETFCYYKNNTVAWDWFNRQYVWCQDCVDKIDPIDLLAHTEL